jgi:hypothetical protein
MDPVLLRGAFRIGFVILILALLVLPFEDPSSPEFVAAFLAFVVGLLFVTIVTMLARYSLPPPPRSSARNPVDKATGKAYNDSDSRSGGNR